MDSWLPDDFDPDASAERPAHREKHSHKYCQEGADESGDPCPAECGPEGPRCEIAAELSDPPHESSMLQRLLDLSLSLLAPPRNAGPQEMRRHAVALSVAVALIYGHIAIACGWLSSIGLAGFASASSVSSVKTEMAEVRITLYGIAIRDLHRMKCNASTYDDQSNLNDQLQKELSKYRNATGREYQLPECPKL